GIERGAVELLQRYDWPGNVRELENVLERAVALAHDGETIGPAHLPTTVRGHEDATPNEPTAGPAPAPLPASNMPLRQARAEFEAQFIRQVLVANNRNVSRSARALG